MEEKENESPMNVVSTTTLLPDHWLGRVRYRLITSVSVPPYDVPEGFVTDGASVPRIFWSVFPPVGRYFVAAIVHDYALEQGVGWHEANGRFDYVLRKLGIRGWRRILMVKAVQLNGIWQHLRHYMGLSSRYVR